MSAECGICQSPSELFLCNRHIEKLRQTLSEFGWWLARLTETAVGQTRMGDNGGRKSARRDELHGDDHPIALLPEAKTLEQSRRERQRRVLASALAAGGCNARASELLAEIADSLGYWVRVLCESRGVDVPALIGGRDYGVPIVAWLHQHVAAIALSEDAGDIAADVFAYRRDIERAVNRPIQWIDLGECPTLIDDEQGGQCGRRLRAPAGEASTVRCRDCGSVHDVNWLTLQNVSKPMTWELLSRAATTAHESYRINRITLWRWRNEGRITSVGIDDNGAALWSWHDLQRVKAETRPGRKRLVNA